MPHATWELDLVYFLFTTGLSPSMVQDSAASYKKFLGFALKVLLLKPFFSPPTTPI